MSALVDHVAEGLGRLRPRAARDPRFVAVITVLLKQVQHLDDLMVELGDLWSLGHDRAPLWMLEQIGVILDMPRSPAWSKSVYRQILRARAVARKSRGTYDDVVRLADALRGPNTVDHATVTVTHPEALQVAIPNLAAGLGPKAYDLIIGAIQETTQLSVTAVSDTEGGVEDQIFFKFNDGPGFDTGKLAPSL